LARHDDDHIDERDDDGDADDREIELPVPDDAVVAYAQAITGAWLAGLSGELLAGLGAEPTDDLTTEFLGHLGEGELLAAVLASLLSWSTQAWRAARADGVDPDALDDTVREMDDVALGIARAIVAMEDDDPMSVLEGLYDVSRDLAVEPYRLAEALTEVTWRLVWLALDQGSGRRPWFSTLALIDPRTPTPRRS
jgi:hypothetical protein